MVADLKGCLDIVAGSLIGNGIVVLLGMNAGPGLIVTGIMLWYELHKLEKKNN